MSLFKRENRDAALGNLTDLLALREGGLRNYSGEEVNEQSALGISAVFSAISLLADSIALLPMKTLRYDAQKVIFTDKPKFLEKPNVAQDISMFSLVHQTISTLAMHGNAFILVDRDRQGRPIQLTPIHPEKVKVEMDNGKKCFMLMTKRGQYDRKITTYNMLHLVWYQYPGQLTGVSPLRANGNTYGLALAMERHLSQFYGQGGTPSSVLETDRDLTAEQASILKDTWLGNHNRNRKPAVLTGGLKWKAISAAAGNELIDAREQITHEIARVFRIPAHLLLAKDGSNVYSNLESNGLAFIRHTLLPWIRRIEDSFTTLLPGKQFVRLDTDEYARGDQLSRVRSFQVAISSGMMTPNEARAKLDLEPYEGGDKFYIGLQGALIDPTLPPQGVDEHDPTNTLPEE
jgi:HK97 family phage portal protein|tara:strand:- start:863 stop:2074 length:1212 start_codon:yes stop_codon:yes gene_type:complete